MIDPTTAVSATPGMRPRRHVHAEAEAADEQKHGHRPSSETAIAISVRPAISTQAGTGVARRRLRIPSSRSTVIEMTRLMNEAAITASAEIPGT